ncbi:MAG: hypothetical protein ACPG52_08200 [Cognaticolwellia sp.]
MMQKMLIVILTGLGLLYLFYFSNNADDSRHKDKHQVRASKIHTEADVVKNVNTKLKPDRKARQLQKNSQYTETDELPIPQSNDSFSRSPILPRTEALNNSTRLSSEQKLYNALADIPMNYHGVLYLKNKHDKDLIDDYTEVVNNTAPDDSNMFDGNVEGLLSSFLYQHEQSPQIALEYLGCSSAGCVIYGVELQTGVWNQLLESAKEQSWWEFSKHSTRSNIGADGNLIFFTILR